METREKYKEKNANHLYSRHLEITAVPFLAPSKLLPCLVFVHSPVILLLLHHYLLATSVEHKVHKHREFVSEVGLNRLDTKEGQGHEGTKESSAKLRHLSGWLIDSPDHPIPHLQVCLALKKLPSGHLGDSVS